MCDRRRSGGITAIRECIRFLQGWALNLVPKPVEEWEATTWILAAIGDLYFLAGSFEKSVGRLRTPCDVRGDWGTPLSTFDSESVALSLAERIAGDELTRAFMGAGREILEKRIPSTSSSWKLASILPPVNAGCEAGRKGTRGWRGIRTTFRSWSVGPSTVWCMVGTR